MKFKNLIFTLTFLFLLEGCSSSYKQLSNMKEKKPINFQEYLHNEYKKKANFEAKEMHDWNSAKLYAEKALMSLETDKIYPEKVSYWKLSEKYMDEIKMGYDNLMTIYDNAKIIDPYNLAKAISSLDCWSEQQEENWQTWDINSCKEDFLKSLHIIYEKISSEEKNKKSSTDQKNKFENILNDEVTVVTKGKNNELLQIIYFDFDKFNLSNVSKNKIKLFIEKNKSEINEYLVLGHTDTKGSKEYNILLSIKRAEVVKELLKEYGVNKNRIKILGKGEESLAIDTPDETKQPANRRVEIKKTN